MNEETFGAELARRADDVHGVPLTFEQVRRRAHGIRRRRRALASGAVAAVVAAAIVVPAVLTGGTDRSTPQPAGPPPTPGASVLHDGVVTEPDGGTVRIGVDNADVVDLSVLTDGRVVVGMQKPYAVRVYAPDGSLEQQYAVQGNALTTSAARDAVAWVGDDFRLRVLSAGRSQPETMEGIPMPGEAAGSIDAVLDAGHLLVGDWATTTGEVTSTGYEKVPTGTPLRVMDVSPDGALWAVQYRDDRDPQYGCAGLYDPQAERLVARSCDAYGLRFSPDGQHLLSGFWENNMTGAAEILDLRLRRVGRFDPQPRVISSTAWADATHVVAGIADVSGDRCSLVRFGLDGADPEVVRETTCGGNPEATHEFVLTD